jgi:hypothetical protein
MLPYVQRAVAQTGSKVLVIYATPSFYLGVNPLPVEYSPPRYRPPAVLHLGGWTIEREALELRVAAKVREVLKGLVPNLVVTKVRELHLTAERAKHEPGWAWPTVPVDRMENLTLHLDRLLATVEAEGMRPVLVTHANRFNGAMQDTLGPDRRHLINPISLYYPRATFKVLVGTDSVANTIMRTVGASHRAMVVEAEEQIPASPTYFGDFVHLTDAGADLMARIIVQAILAHAASATRLPLAASHH